MSEPRFTNHAAGFTVLPEGQVNHEADHSYRRFKRRSGGIF